MTSTLSSLVPKSASRRVESPSAALPFSARGVLKLLAHLRHGTLHLELPDGQVQHLGRGDGPEASLRIHDSAMLARVLRSGDIGLAESYLDGQWSTPDLPGLLLLLALNRDTLEQLVYGRWWGQLAYRVQHWLNRNTRANSRKNIHAHYDLGNAFYALWLDPSMNYSSAWFDGDFHRDLPSAQNAKMWRALDACAIQQGDRVLEIGCGWGAVAETATRDWGANCVGVTLSPAQLEWAQRRLAQAGLAKRADLRLQDYRDLNDEPYDAIISIEMFEAVGREWWPSYFQTLHRQLKPGGRACVQSITIRDDLFERYSRSTDFIQQYIFPGGMLPSPSEFVAHAQQAGLRVVEQHAFGPDYAETLRRWRAAFVAQETQVRAQGFDQRFVRLWTFYLAYCEAAFDSGCTDVIQFTLVRD